ncbi:MAG: SurA N-terminal domain-containing protein [Kiritimatiellae bacterium]|nr:SurA N-terminal domain-containing protein [Kiritimatiellia bacterium]
MVIQKFNKIIRNKWIWGAFAVAISAFFAFDFLIMKINSPEQAKPSSAYGSLAGEAVDGELFSELALEVRGIGPNRDWKRDQGEVNREAWENYAALKVAAKNGIEATDEEVAEMIRRDPSFSQNGAFSFQIYQMLLRQNSLQPEKFEESLKRRLTLMRLNQAILGSAVWGSPLETEQALSDMVDTFTVKIARFRQSKKDADAVKLDDKALEKWYIDNTNSIALPERIKLRLVRYDANASNVLAKMVVTEDEMRDRYDVVSDKYTVTDTNGVETVKKFEEVKGEIEKELRLMAAVEFFRTNLNIRAYAVKAKAGSSRLDEIAAEDGKKVAVSDWMTLSDRYVEGFMHRIASVFPGAEAAAETIAELDSSSEDLRYGVIVSEKTVWLVELAETSASHVPSFKEAKSVITPRALSAARADAFKASIASLAEKGTNALFAAAYNVSSNISFSVSDMRQGEFSDQFAVARAATKLAKGELSPLSMTAPSRGLVVYCVDRVPGDAAKTTLLKSQIQNEVTSLQLRQLSEEWKKSNLERMGFTVGDMSSIESQQNEE